MITLNTIYIDRLWVELADRFGDAVLLHHVLLPDY
jgi:hypothetical protein